MAYRPKVVLGWHHFYPKTSWGSLKGPGNDTYPPILGTYRPRFTCALQRHKATFDYFVKIELLDKNMTFNIVCARKKTRTVVQKRSPIHGNFPDDSYYWLICLVLHQNYNHMFFLLLKKTTLKRFSGPAFFIIFMLQ